MPDSHSDRRRDHHIDGTAVIPADLIDEVMDRAMEIESREDDVRDRLLGGASLEDTYMTIGAI